MSGWSEEKRRQDKTRQDKRTERRRAEIASSAEIRLGYNLCILGRSSCVMIAKGTRSWTDEEDLSRLLFLATTGTQPLQRVGRFGNGNDGVFENCCYCVWYSLWLGFVA